MRPQPFCCLALSERNVVIMIIHVALRIDERVFGFAMRSSGPSRE
jgi:hypothetical protein